MAMALDFPVTDQSVSASSGPKAYLAKFNSNGTLAFSRLFGGGATTAGTGIAVDGSGNIYLAGATSSPNFPAKNAFQSLSMKDPVLSSILGLRSAFAAKFASDGKTLVYATLVGGTGDDAATAAAEDGQGNLYLAGSTGSTDLPVLNAVQEGLAGAQNGFVAELNPQGNALVFLTYLGGSQKDTAQNLALGSQGSIYVGGSATSADFPVLNGTDTTKSKATTNARSAFAVKFAPGGRGIIFSTLLGGSKDDAGNGIAADSAGAAYLAGTTASADFPLTGAFQASFGGQWDMFLAKVVPDSASASPIVALPASVGFTMISGGATPAAQGIDVALAGTGVSGAFTTTASTASGGNWLSITPAAGSVPGQIAVSVQPAGIGVGLYGGMIQIAPASGSPVSVPVTFRVVPPTPVLTSVTPAEFGGVSFAVLSPPPAVPTVTLTISGTGFVTGATAWVSAFTPGYTVSYPTTFVDSKTLQLNLPVSVMPGPLSLTVSNPGTPQSNVLNLLEGQPIIGAANVTGTVAPGNAVVIGGINLGGLVPFVAPVGGPPVTTLGNTQVFFDGVPAQPISTYFFQVRAVVPANVAGEVWTKIVVKYFGQNSFALTVPTAGNSLPPDPLGPGISGVLNPSGQINSAISPTTAGELVTLVIDNSQVAPGAVAVSATVGGVPATVTPVPNPALKPPDKTFLNLQIPAGAPAGSAVPITVRFQNTEATARFVVAIQ